jgi:BirA family transcriptional regulator, biotin operon repressor / biotin---[acetyl-CoA-carboxylase] ligase
MATDKNKMSFINANVYEFDTVESTQASAKKLLADGKKPPFIVVAQVQTNGVGRFGRKWSSPQGGIYMTLVHPKPPVAQISLALSVALSDAIKKATDFKTTVKWPNDLLLNGKKVAGILCEIVGDNMLCGIGVNTFPKMRMPDEIKEFAETFELNDHKKEKIKLFFLSNLESGWKLFCLAGFGGIIQSRYLELCPPVGTSMSVSDGDKKLVGKFVTVDGEGALVLSVDGKRQKFISGDTEIVR